VVAKPAPAPASPAADAAAQPVLQALAASPRINVALGQQRSNDNPVLYVSLLRKFVAAQADVVQRIQHALLEGDRATAERLAHTLKGLAANLGAATLQAAAGQLETSLRQDAAAALATADLLAPVAAELQLLIGELRAAPGLLLAEEAPKGALSASERLALETVVQQIRDLLAQDDAQAAELWDMHASGLRRYCPQAARIEAAIADFEFEQALELLSPASLPG
jgi:HPt (histidine-containing phosphotransfer) domain-containing protein